MPKDVTGRVHEEQVHVADKTSKGIRRKRRIEAEEEEELYLQRLYLQRNSGKS